MRKRPHAMDYIDVHGVDLMDEATARLMRACLTSEKTWLTESRNPAAADRLRECDLYIALLEDRRVCV